MRRILLSAAAVVATLLLPLAAHTPLAQGNTHAALAAGATYARVIVKYRADSDLMKEQAVTATGKRILQTQALGDRIGIALTSGIGLSDRSHVVMAQGLSSSSLAARLAVMRDIEYAVVDERRHIVAAPNDPRYASGPVASGSSGGPAVGQWYLKPPNSINTSLNTAPSSINAEQAWDVTTGSASVIVAVLDTGIRPEHPDLQGGNMLPGYDFVGADENGSGASLGTFLTANDGDGRDSNPSDPGDWITQVEANQTGGVFFHCGAQDSAGNYVGEASSWHGTQTLSLIGAATNNGIGMASVGRNVSVMPVRVLGKCGGFDSDIAAGMLWAAQIAVPGVPANANKARVISMSLGGGSVSCSTLYQDTMTQLTAAGVVVVAAAGNDGTAVGTPANCPGVIAVGGLRSDGDKNGFSSLGPEVLISSPGGNCGTGAVCLYPIVTATNTGTTGPVASTYSDGFNASLGTSFSTPLVAGTVGLMLSVQPSLTPAGIRAKLVSTARPFPTSGSTVGVIPTCSAPTSTAQSYCYCTTSTCGAGMLDAHAAVLAAASVQAQISVTTATPIAGAPVLLTSTSTVGSGTSIASYLWAVTSPGTTGATITSGQGTQTVTTMPTAAGTFSVSLTATDSSGSSSTATSVVSVAPAAVVTPPSSGSSGGGGALNGGWLMLLLTAVLALAAVSRFERRRAVRDLSAPARASRRR